MKSKKIKIKAYAKVNLFLKITGIREDGYHILSSTMQTISLYDSILVKKSDKLLCLCGDIPSEKNIAYKAVCALEEVSGKKLPVFIKIKKRIPDKAGLGGGSADAAAVMKAVIRLYDLFLSEKEIILAAEKAGADVPFFIYGGTAFCGGIGEVVKKRPSLPPCYILIAKPKSGNSTPEMFKAFDSFGQIGKCKDRKFTAALKSGEIKKIASLLENDLTPFDISGEVKPLKEKLLSLSALGSEMSGSGTAVFAIFDDKKKAKTAAKELKKDYKVFLTKPI